MKIHDVELEWLGHAAFKIRSSKEPLVLYIDPYQISKTFNDADFVLITHSHYDHCSIEDIGKVVKDGTVMLCTADAQSKIVKISKKLDIKIVEPNVELDFNNIKIKTIEAYNHSKKFHPKAECWIGYILQIGSIVIYHSGDTDLIKEMEKLSGYGRKENFFVALLPVGGTYTMNAQEAAQAASVIKPSLAIPMHYGSIVGSRGDAEIFVELCKKKGIKAEILEKS